MEKPIVTVLMTAFNAEKYIDEAIKSILGQTFKKFTFLVINDGSTDSTEQIILSYDDSRIQYVKNPENIGLIKSLNKGLDLIETKYLTRMDADDISLTDRLEKQIRFMEENPNIDISGGQMKVFGMEEGVTNYPLTHTECQIRLLDQTCFSNNLFIAKTEQIIHHKLKFNLQYLHAEDHKFYCDCLQKLTGANLSDILTEYRRHSESITLKHKNHAIQTRKKIRIEYAHSLLNLTRSQSNDLYSTISLRKLRSIIIAKKQGRIIFDSAYIKYLNYILFQSIWYKDGLREAESSYKTILLFPLILLIKPSIRNFLNWLFCIKNYLSHLANGRS